MHYLGVSSVLGGYMVRATRRALFLLSALWLSACAESGKDANRPHFADGETRSEDAELESSGGLGCTTSVGNQFVTSGSSFTVNITFFGGTPPYSILGGSSGLSATGATLTGSITSTSSQLSQVKRRIPIADSAGHTASCYVTVMVIPAS